MKEHFPVAVLDPEWQPTRHTSATRQALPRVAEVEDRDVM